MKLYFCELANNGIIEARFFREGSSAKDVKEELEVLQWPDGEWRITLADER